MATATSRKAKPDPKILKARRAAADRRLTIEASLAEPYAEMGKLDAQLKQFATDAGESFKEDFGERGSVAVAGAVSAEFKGKVPEIQTEAWLALSALERKRLEKSGLVKMVEQWGKASNGRVTVKVL